MKAHLWFLGLVVLTLLLAHPKTASADNVSLGIFGLNSQADLYTDEAAACNELIASGVQYVRICPTWQQFEPTRGSFNTSFETTVDDIVNRLSAAHIKIDFVLGYSALWATTKGSNIFDPPANMTDWSNFVNFVTTRYNNKVTYWEVWNEEDTTAFWTGTTQQYVTLLQTATAQIRQANPNNVVLMGGIAAEVGQVGLNTFFDTMMKDGAGGYFDIINYHAYGTNYEWRTGFAGMQAVINSHNLQSMPIWITETGYTTGGNTSLEPVKGQYLESAYYSLLGLSPNIQKIFLYVDRNTNTGNADQDNYGLCTNANRTPLEALYHYQAIDGAESNFAMQTAYPSTEYRRTLNYIVNTADTITNYAQDGSQKQIATGSHMYFELNDDWLANVLPIDNPIYIDVTYLDSGTGQWELFYDGNINPYETYFVTYTNTGQWLTKTFTLTDAKFANQQTYSADFGIKAVSSPLVVQSVNVRHNNAKGWVSAGSATPSDQSWQMWPEDNTETTDGGYCPIATMGGVTCREITDESHYLVYAVSELLVPPTDTNATVSITYWDSGTDEIVFAYCAVGNPSKAVYFHKTNTNTWQTYTKVLTDVDFTESIYQVGDIWISTASGSPQYISSVTVTSP